MLSAKTQPNTIIWSNGMLENPDVIIIKNNMYTKKNRTVDSNNFLLSYKLTHLSIHSGNIV